MRSVFVSAAFLLFLAFNLSAQYEYTFEDTVAVYEDLFFLNEPLNLTLEFNIKEFKKARRKDDYHRANMTCHVSESFLVSHPVRVRARGEYRRDNCTMPPYWINIRYAGIEADSLRDVRKMKMVTRCKGAASYKDYVLKEYLVYKIYNLLTDISFNVRLVRLTYINTGSKKNTTTEDWGFLIEPEEMMARRLEAKMIKSDKLSLRTVNREMMDLMALFQYMVGHGDYSVTGRHNLKILALKNPPPAGFITVPYDFDYCGLVDAQYAIPGETLGITTVTERYYLGACREKAIHMETIQQLAQYRDEIEDLIMGFEYLDEKVRLGMLTYISSYFKASEKNRFVEAFLDPTCR
ncbi:MAG: hypothetical protein ABFS28_15585 [Bacteroidota bacterium]